MEDSLEEEAPEPSLQIGIGVSQGEGEDREVFQAEGKPSPESGSLLGHGTFGGAWW